MTLPCVVPLCFIQRHACVLASTRPRLAPCNTRPSSSSLLDHIWRVEGDHAVVRRLRQQRLRHHVRRRAPRSPRRLPRLSVVEDSIWLEVVSAVQEEVAKQNIREREQGAENSHERPERDPEAECEAQELRRAGDEPLQPLCAWAGKDARQAGGPGRGERRKWWRRHVPSSSGCCSPLARTRNRAPRCLCTVRGGGERAAGCA